MFARTIAYFFARYIRIHDKFHENRCRFIDDEAIQDDEDEEDGEEEDQRENEMDYDDPFINDGEMDYTTTAKVAPSSEEKKKRLLEQLERKKRQLERLEKKIKDC